MKERSLAGEEIKSLPPPVGLSDPQYAARRKAMFEFLTRMHALGWVPLSWHFIT